MRRRAYFLACLAICALTACGGTANTTNSLSQEINLDRLKVIDEKGRQLNLSIIEKALPMPVTVTLDGKILAGENKFFQDQNIRQRLAAKIKSRLEGAFLYLPWGKSEAIVGGFSAINMPSLNKVFICGGDESPNHIRFAPDKTWLVDMTSGKVTQGPELNWPRKSPTLTYLKDGRILISGGKNYAKTMDSELSDQPSGENLPAQLEIYDPASQTITTAGRLLAVKDICAALQLDNGSVLLVGTDQERAGTGALPARTPVMELYDPKTTRTKILGPLRRLTTITWCGAAGDARALLLGQHCDLNLNDAEIGQPAAELIDTQLKPPP